jgi:hypothetical protein
MSKIEQLADRYRAHIAAPWQRNLSGDQKAIFVVYPKHEERRLRARLESFELATIEAGHGWRLLDLTSAFAEWMANTNYRDSYFEEPESLAMKLRTDFLRFAAERLLVGLRDETVDEDTVVAVQGIACLFGFTRVSLLLKEIAPEIRGRLVVFFPGEYEDNHYRLLDARDGWNYLAVPITLHNGVHDA